jgi:hypothetical protein
MMELSVPELLLYLLISMISSWWAARLMDPYADMLKRDLQDAKDDLSVAEESLREARYRRDLAEAELKNLKTRLSKMKVVKIKPKEK